MAAIGYCFTWSLLMWLLKRIWNVLSENSDSIHFDKSTKIYQVTIPPLRLTFFSSQGVPYWTELGMCAVHFSSAFFFLILILNCFKKMAQISTRQHPLWLSAQYVLLYEASSFLKLSNLRLSVSAQLSWLVDYEKKSIIAKVVTQTVSEVHGST